MGDFGKFIHIGRPEPVANSGLPDVEACDHAGAALKLEFLTHHFVFTGLWFASVL
jgi:hypothetical protein